MNQEAPVVVVSGVGAVTAHGLGAERLWQGLVAGNVAIRTVQGLDLAGCRTTLGGEVERDRRGEDDAALEFLLAAAREAMCAAGIRPMTHDGGAGHVAAARFGTVLGTCNAGLRSAEQAERERRASGQLDWRRHLMIQPQVLAEALSAEFGLRGPTLSVSTACASGAHAIAHAAEMLRSGRADAMLVGGTDAFTETAFAGFHSLESLSARPAAPYCRRRDGLSLGEGSGVLVLTTLPIARAAGAPVLAEVAGYGLSADGYHPTAPRPDGAGAARAMTVALADAGLAPEDVDYVNGHGTGTPKNDVAESAAVRLALGTHSYKTPLSSIKSMIGHLLGAAGAVEGIATIMAIRDQIAPPTAGFTEPDPGCGLDPIAGLGQHRTIDVALSNSFAFAGANATVAYTRRDHPEQSRPAPSRASCPGRDDVVVTGVGVLLPAAADQLELWRAYSAGPARQECVHGLRVARVVDPDPAGVVPPRQGRRMDRLGLFAVLACRRALKDAGLDPDARGGDRIGVVLGTGLGPVESIEAFAGPVLDEGPAAANPALFPNTVYNAAAGQVAQLLGARGPTSTVTSSHAAGAAALGVAEDLLRAGHADALLCPAVDALSATAVGVYAGTPLFRPSSARDCLLAEGAVALLLERRSAAQARDARVLGVLTGHAITSDAAGIGRWDAAGRGIERAMRTALDVAGLEVGDLSTIWSNTTGLPPVDRSEDAAIARLLEGTRVTVHRPKLSLGEPVGAGAQQAAALVLHHWSTGGDRGPALINSSSLGGTHVTLILSPEKDVN